MVLALLVTIGVVVRVRERVLRESAQALELQVSARTQEVSARSAELEVALVALQGTQVELVRAEQLASTAMLVRGIAHELNNPLGQLATNLGPLQRYVAFLVRSMQTLAPASPGTLTSYGP